MLEDLDSEVGRQSEEWLFDLARDTGEQNSRWTDQPAETARLKELLRQWETQVKPAR